MSLDLDKIKKKNIIAYLDYALLFKDYYNNVLFRNKKYFISLSKYKAGAFMGNNLSLYKKEPLELNLKEYLKIVKYLEVDKLVEKNKKDINTEIINYYLDKNIGYKKELEITLGYLKNIDKIIYNAPKTQHKMIVYRAMKDILYEFNKCENGELYYTNPNFLSTSLTLSTPYQFLHDGYDEMRNKTFMSNNALYSIIVPTNMKSLAIPWLPHLDEDSKSILKEIKNIKFEELSDSQFEILLPRKCKFKLIKSEYISLKNINELIFNFSPSDKECLKNNKYKIKHYTIELVEQADIKELEKDYAKIKKNMIPNNVVIY
jgi:hypothetical protein